MAEQHRTERTAATEKPTGLRASLVIPAKDEDATVADLCRRIVAVFERDQLGGFEILLIDDGSSDGTWEAMSALAAGDDRIRAIRLRRNFGKAIALQVGIDLARADVIVTMDADLQDDPEEIPRFLALIDEGYGLVSGWKRERHDPLTKTLPSRLFNAVTAWVSGVPLHDFNCGFKAYRREIFEHVDLYGELHRYIPVLADNLGYRVGELVVTHHPRRHGVSKYGAGRLAKGLLDLVTVVTITRFGRRPGHLFGGIGLAMITAASAILGYLAILRFVVDEQIGTRPLLTFGVLLMILGTQCLFFGMIAELVISRQRRPGPNAYIATPPVGER